MSAIPTIMKGDTPVPITITVPDALMRLTVSYQGIVRTYHNVEASVPVVLDYTSNETAAFRLGTFPLVCVGVSANGSVKTYPLMSKIKVTDCPGEVYNAPIEIDGGKTDFDLRDVEIDMDDPQNTINAVIARIVAKGGGTVRGLVGMCLALCVSLCGALDVETAAFGTLSRNSNVVVRVGSETDPTVPAWAKAPVPPEGMSTNAVEFTGGGLVTHDGSHTVTAADVGALSSVNPNNPYQMIYWDSGYNGLRIFSNVYSAYDWNGSVSAGGGNYIMYAGEPVVYGLSINGEQALHGDVQIEVPTKAEMQEMRVIVQTWEGFFDGSNVVFEVTNYISGACNLDAAKFKIKELKPGATNYVEVYNSRDEILLHIGDFSNRYVRVALEAIVAEVAERLANKADKAWGQYTSAGGDAPSNTVYMTAPNTVFAGGMEYERVAVGEGAVCVLTTHGAPVYTQGDEGTFKFQDDGGTNYFGFAKTDSYTIGCNTDGIQVGNNIVTLEYDITMSGVPCVWYAESLDVQPIVWEQLNTSDGEPIAGASHVVQWELNPPVGKEICYINCTEASGFFKATVEVPGDSKFMTNMKADLSGGVLCTDGQTVIYPHANGTWSTTK